MIDIKTRPNTTEIKLRDEAALAPKELAQVIKETSTTKILYDHSQADEIGGTGQSTAVNNTFQGFKADTKSTAAYTAKKAYKGGKALAQKSYDSKFRTSKYSDKNAQNDQYNHSRRISFSEAIPGDIVFFSDLSHVGIYAGLNEEGQPIVIQCGSGGVSVTSLSIFSIIARPNILE